ncbi:glycosyltransferase 87 family protein [Allokutzneria sp. A3M-2-11 16]|uniref:glycosyltransferase 87 family protein n=1 Tax=Allokutzneria sp. A3M-2-11 16 TaxID=2962043 RepID=UPI0020B8624B|nr:glycosyltransferase 87 family protein [Allokutzneria sp. A3M-2-11 16]MCP3803068.1 glycosyltransferase 87 family protein [Allokutzneria sp. A3M-2-11 16]
MVRKFHHIGSACNAARPGGLFLGVNTVEAHLRRPVVLVAGVVVVLALALWQVTGKMLVDLDVYRAGAEAWMTGQRLYDEDFPPRPLVHQLPFTYPPFAAVLFSVLTPLSLKAMGYVMTAATALALAAACVIVARRCGLPRASAGGLGFAVAALSVLSEPVLATIGLGQVNTLLLAMVVADCLLPRTPWPRGLLVGIAAGIKLTPAIFVLYFLASGRVRPALTAIATLAGSVVIGFLATARDSAQYWFSTLFNTDRIGGPEFVTNQSIRGVLGRFGLVNGQVFPFWVAGVLITLVVTWLILRRVRSEVPALLVVAAAGLLCSPVSWSNHWVWASVLATAVAVALLRRPRWSLLAPGVATVVLFVGPHRFVPGGGKVELTWTAAQWPWGNAFFLTAVISLVVLLVRNWSREVDNLSGDRGIRTGERAQAGLGRDDDNRR